MKFILTAGWDDGIADLTERLVRELVNGKKVLWLTSGGSNIPATVQIMENIPTTPSKNLTVLLADERFGEVGHQASNWNKLMQAGLDQKNTTLLPILERGQDEAKAVQKYNHLAEEAFANNDLVIAQLGIGPDGHIAGLLPRSSALKEESELVAGFLSDETPPMYRMTMTFKALRRIDVAYSFAFGKPKRQALTNLEYSKLSLSDQPCQILRQIPEAYIYNDQIGNHA